MKNFSVHLREFVQCVTKQKFKTDFRRKAMSPPRRTMKST